MSNESARRVMETTCPETANQYLRFGWKLINQYAVEATADTPAQVKYVLASVRKLEDTRAVVTLTDPEAVNAHLALGWKLIDKHVSASDDPQRRHEVLHFVLAWQSDDPPQHPGSAAAANAALDAPIEIDESPAPETGQV